MMNSNQEATDTPAGKKLREEMQSVSRQRMKRKGLCRGQFTADALLQDLIRFLFSVSIHTGSIWGTAMGLHSSEALTTLNSQSQWLRGASDWQLGIRHLELIQLIGKHYC